MGKKERRAKPCGTPHPFLHKSKPFRKQFLRGQPARKSENDSHEKDCLEETINAANLPDSIEGDAFRYSTEEIPEGCLIISDTSGLSSESYPSVFYDKNEEGITKEDSEDESGSSWRTISSETEIERTLSVENPRFAGADTEDANDKTWRFADSYPEISKFGTELLPPTKIFETPTKCRRISLDTSHSEQEDEFNTTIKKVSDEDIIPPLFPEWENEEEIIPPLSPERENDKDAVIASNSSEQSVFGSPLLTSTKINGFEVSSSMECLPSVSPVSKREDDVSNQGKGQNLTDQMSTPTQASHHKTDPQVKKRKKFIFNKFPPGENQQALTASEVSSSMECLPCVSPVSKREDDVSNQGKGQDLKDQMSTPTHASHHKTDPQAKKRKKLIFNKFPPGENQQAFTAEKSHFTCSEAETNEDKRTVKHVKMKNGDEFRIYFGDYELSVKKTIGSKSEISESGYAEREDSLNHEKLKLRVKSNQVNDCRSRVNSLQKKLQSTGKANLSEILEALVSLQPSDKIDGISKVVTPSLTSTTTSSISEVATSPLNSAKIPGTSEVAIPRRTSAKNSERNVNLEFQSPALCSVNTKGSRISADLQYLPRISNSPNVSSAGREKSALQESIEREKSKLDDSMMLSANNSFQEEDSQRTKKRTKNKMSKSFRSPINLKGSRISADLQYLPRISNSPNVSSAGREKSALQESIDREKSKLDDSMMLSANNSFQEEDSQRTKKRTKNKMSKSFRSPINLEGPRISADLQYLPRISNSPNVSSAGREKSALQESIEREKSKLDDSMMLSANNPFQEEDSQQTKTRTKSKMNKFFKSPINLKGKQQSIKGSKKKTKKASKKQSKKQDKSKMSSGTSVFDFIVRNRRSESSTSISSPWPSTNISSTWPSTNISSTWSSTSTSNPQLLASSSSFQHVYSNPTSDSQNKISRFEETPICPLSLRETPFEEIEDLSSPPGTWNDLENTSICRLALRPLRR